MVEEYCRFVLNSPDLTARTKQIRHKLAGAILTFDAGKLLACRDTIGDVGTTTRVAGQLKRTDLNDCLTAGSKRIVEALRALAEVIQTEDPQLAQSIETLRYQCYTLEKDIAIRGIPAEKYRRVRLYVLITSNLEEEVLPLVDQCTRGGADCIQLRCKHITDRGFLELAKRFVAQCKSHNTLSIINDRVDIAVAAQADGVHLGLDDISIDDARMLQCEPLIFGLTTHNANELDQACAENPTYAALGPAYASETKPGLPCADPDFIRNGVETLQKHGLGHVVIGGINHTRVNELLGLGVRTIAVCSNVCNSHDPEEACRCLSSMLKNRSTDQ